MEVQIKAPGYTVAEETVRHIEKRADGLSRFVHEKDMDTAVVEVHIERLAEHPQQGRVWQVKLGMTSRGKTMHTEAVGEGIIEAFDIAKDEMDLRLKGLKDKRRTLLRHGGARIKQMLRFGRGS